MKPQAVWWAIRTFGLRTCSVISCGVCRSTICIQLKCILRYINDSLLSELQQFNAGDKLEMINATKTDGKKMRWNSIKSSNRKCQLLRQPWLSCKLERTPFTARTIVLCCCQKLFWRRLWHHTSCNVYAWIPEYWEPITPYHRLRGTTHTHTHWQHRPRRAMLNIDRRAFFIFRIIFMWFSFSTWFFTHSSFVFTLLNVQLFADQIITSRAAQLMRQHRRHQHFFDNIIMHGHEKCKKKRKKKISRFKLYVWILFVRKQNLRNTETV